jgi:hypothetical protein
MERCDRCKKEITSWSVSYFNTEKCCPECLEKEKKHPLYKYAKDMEHEQVKAGNYNYPGIGKPDDL